jgi:hypothetical protein
VLIHDLEDEAFLLFRAAPNSVVSGLDVPIAVATVAVAAMSIAVSVSVSVAAIAIRAGQKPHVFDRSVNAVLKQFVEAGTFGLDLVNVGNFGPERDAELMAAGLGQAELFTVVAFERCHDSQSSLFIVGTVYTNGIILSTALPYVQ